jgi:hypothetical protein
MDWFVVEIIVLLVVLAAGCAYMAWKSETFRVQLAYILGITLVRSLMGKYSEWKESKRDSVPDLPADSSVGTGADPDQK